MAILTVELEESDPERILIRVRTVDDVLDPTPPQEQPFADVQKALSHVAAWLEGWRSAARVVTEEER